VFEAAIQVKSTNLIKPCLKTRKKNIEVKEIFLYESPSKRSFNIEFTACQYELTTEEAPTSFTVSDA